MAAVLENLEIGLKKTGGSVDVPNDHKARLMFYLDCICNVLNFQNYTTNLARLRNYSNHYLLSDNDLDELVILCLLVSPEVLINKVIFANEEMCGHFQNQFYELSAVQNRFPITDSILIGGTQRRVRKIMTFKMVFLELNYLAPMRFFQPRLERIAALVRQRHRPSIAYHSTYTSRNNNDTGCCTIL